MSFRVSAIARYAAAFLRGRERFAFVAGARVRIALLVAAALPALVPTGADAHPLGNFTVNHLTRLAVHGDVVDAHYVLDLAEIPTVALDRTLAAGGDPTPAQYAAWGAAHAREIAPLLELRAAGASVVLLPQHTSVTTRPGAAGLRIVYFTADYRGALPVGARSFTYVDRTEDGRLGWKDVVLAPSVEPTKELRVYPSALVGSPRSRIALSAAIDSAGIAHQIADPPAAAPAPDAPSVARMNALSDLLDRGGSGPLVLLGAVLIAIGLGALHALEPGHGKTLLAVSLVGARATARQALVLASSLTVAHTAGVLVLGALVLFATRWIVPEAVYPWITLGSGIFVAVLGARSLAAEVRRRRPVAHVHVHSHAGAHAHAHDHVHGHGDDHVHGFDDDEAHARAHAVPGAAPLTFRTAVMAAASGNLAPCPAALVVLLAAISLHRIALGMLLIVAFSVGLAATLTLLGLAVVRGAAWLGGRPQFAAAARWAPIASATAIALVGAVMVGQGFVAGGIVSSGPAVAALTVLAIVGYAFASPHRAMHARTRSA
jgi:ABC-type nickel/cobalt efflux system permease component RcnA